MDGFVEKVWSQDFRFLVKRKWHFHEKQISNEIHSERRVTLKLKARMLEEKYVKQSCNILVGKYEICGLRFVPMDIRMIKIF